MEEKPTGLIGDFNNDGIVDIGDMVEFGTSGAFGTAEGDPRYNAKYDITGDGRVDIADFDLLSKLIKAVHEPTPPEEEAPEKEEPAEDGKV